RGRLFVPVPAGSGRVHPSRILLQRVGDDLLGALGHAGAAAGALVVVDPGQVVGDMDGVGGAVALAHPAGDAGGGAGFHGHRAAVAVGAHDHRLIRAGSLDHDDVLGADRRAGAAAGALVLIHHGHAVDDVDGVELAGLDAVAKAGAGKGAVLGPAVQRGGRSTALDALVVIAGLAVVLAALALDHRLLGDGGHLGAHDLADGGSRLGAAGGALVAGHAVHDDGLGVVSAACIAAAAAVGAGQAARHLLDAGVLLHCHELGCSDQDHRAQGAHD